MDIIEILESNKKTFTDNPDEFLRNFEIDHLNDPEIMKHIKGITNDPNATTKIGAPSGVGSIYHIRDTDFVLKIAKICPESLISKICRVLLYIMFFILVVSVVVYFFNTYRKHVYVNLHT